ncbi:MAG: threonine synthase [Oscillospiraceae bacterium]|nr:threonine synthase [Oscillospiraceae bacterium]
MNYNSTRNSAIKVRSAEAIIKGLSDEGGLFVPESIPKFSASDMKYIGKMNYAERAQLVLKKFLTDFTDDELKSAAQAAYSDNFAVENATQLSQLYPDCYVLELFHGPTCAFKDMALQLLPHLMTISAKKTELAAGKQIAILTATSGDTGKAALEGFKDIENTSVTVFYPEDGVSEMQKRQMTTQEGANVRVCAVRGNFDDCQTGVKEIFTDVELIAQLSAKNMIFSSANSINWGRLVPQIIYYVSAYADLLEAGEIEQGESVNICVPTGNFGNILAAYYAREMGLPIGRLICASNANNVLTDCINTGVYDRNRELILTASPSMDILISSNFERLLYHLSDRDDSVINALFTDLKEKGKYTLPSGIKEKLSELFYGGWCDEAETERTIKKVFDEFGYLTDPHTAVAYKIYDDYKNATGDTSKTIITATASPYKFCAAVHKALGGTPETDEFATARKLEELTKTEMPAPLSRTESLPVRFTDSVEKSEMKRAVSDVASSL